MRGKRIISILCVLTLCLGMTFQVEATGLQEKREQLSDLEKEKAAAEQEKENLSQELEEIVSKALEGMGVKAKVKTEKLKNATVPAVVNVSEFMRRMSEMNRFYQMGEIPDEITLVVNTANPAVLALKGAGEEERKFAVAQIYYLAKLAYKQLSPEEVSAFTQNNVLMLEKYLKI